MVTGTSARRTPNPAWSSDRHGQEPGAGEARLRRGDEPGSIAPYATVNWGLPGALQMPMGDAGRKCFGDGLGVVIQSRCLRGSPSKKLDISQDFAQWQALPLEKRQTVSNVKTQTREEAKKTEKQAFFRQEMAATVCQPPFAISSCAVWLAAGISSPAERHAIMHSGYGMRRIGRAVGRSVHQAKPAPGWNLVRNQQFSCWYAAN